MLAVPAPIQLKVWTATYVIVLVLLSCPPAVQSWLAEVCCITRVHGREGADDQAE